MTLLRNERPCPNCKDKPHGFIRFNSLNYKQCNHCFLKLPNELKPGQKPLVGSSRQKASNPHKQESENG